MADRSRRLGPGGKARRQATWIRPHAKFLDHLPIGVFVLDSQGHPFYANHAAQKLLGRGIAPDVDPHELAERYQVRAAGTDLDYPTDRMPVVRALRGDSVSVDDMEILRPDGRIPLDVWGAPIYDDNGAFRYAASSSLRPRTSRRGRRRSNN